MKAKYVAIGSRGLASVVASSFLAMSASAYAAGADGILSDGFDEDWSAAGARNVAIELPGTVLRGRLYSPTAESRNGAAVVAMHGCRGMWSGYHPDTIAQAAIEKWGVKLSEQGYFVLAIDSYTDRTPPGEDEFDYQIQCALTPMAGFVDPYTERVGDLDAGISWLRYRLGSVVSGAIGALGWSQGAQAVLVRAAETSRGSDTSLYLSPEAERNAIPAAVAFYPGCGPALGFRTSGVSYWRPHRALRLNHGGADPLEADCSMRADRVFDAYGSDWLTYVAFPEAEHSFDGVIDEWPTESCSEADTPDVCAAKDADIASLNFLNENLR